ncbi:MAG: lipoate--protein ligase family protein [Peptococcaceae bacterium]|nr:lipoate--protein ligase family protein [Peptococcaceae bacterium]
MKWRLLNTGYGNGFENMAIDEAILMVHARGGNPPTLRFYGWKPPALSLGYFQNPEETVDFKACRRLGVDVVRRPTGGRAVLHDKEVTYSIIAREDNPAVRGTVPESYLRLSRGLILGLGRLGVEVSCNGDGGPAPKGPACFDSPALYELVAGGRKLAGNAQARKHGCVIQHGALPLVNDAGTLFAVLKFSSEAEREEQRRRFTERSASLEEVMGRRVPPGRVIQALAEGFAEALGIDLEPGGMTEEELLTAERLVREKYLNSCKPPAAVTGV